MNNKRTFKNLNKWIEEISRYCNESKNDFSNSTSQSKFKSNDFDISQLCLSTIPNLTTLVIGNKQDLLEKKEKDKYFEDAENANSLLFISLNQDNLFHKQSQISLQLDNFFKKVLAEKKKKGNHPHRTSNAATLLTPRSTTNFTNSPKDEW